jgi:nitrate/TMAO reductase-like tetraheme cytochrome c subunit
VPLPKDPALKLRFIVAAEAAMRPTAALFNVLEMARAAEVGALAATDRPRYVLSNQTPTSAFAKVAANVVTASPYKILGYAYPDTAMGVAGVAAASLKQHLVRLSDALIAKWRQDLGTSAKDEQRVLLFAGPAEDLQKLVDSKLFTIVISSNASPWSTDPGVAEHDDEAKLRRVGVKTAQPITMVPLGGQGLLRGGRAMVDEAKSVTELLTKPTCAPGKTPGLAGDCESGTSALGTGGKTGGALFRATKLVTWLDRTVIGDGGITKIWGAYEAAVKADFKTQSEARARDLANSPFAGADACQACHPQASAKWATTAHAHALKELKDKGKDDDQECVSCHVVGASAPGGFVSAALSPKLANVQCENCHGPRAAHVKTPGPAAAGAPRAQVPETCVACHNAQHSPAFKPEEYWPRIAHGKG